jgi:hypothetical protein
VTTDPTQAAAPPPESVTPEFFTIGVYGFSAAAFFDALRSARIDTFCDLRRRRGVRGAEYAYANAVRLQSELARLGIRYRHCLDLAPSAALRSGQAAGDRVARIPKRRRAVLDPGFIAGYRQSCLADFNSERFVGALGPEARRVALFCVEREPAACHRSLVAERLGQDLGGAAIHLMP